ncbi:FAD-dependent oxidoreductase [Hasllibacter sp. MH4015]|uniref:FAD-dependent oxidoreductase n=1 Tax=Hasllibacter sp. MH4015 TaxID=2854029 RepID=UPI001CD75AD7|nr:FAD-dependent oxidoreductase [Hasllibacter sp. MH4015]
MKPTHDVAVIGGGPVGTGLAIDLAQRGMCVALVERYLEPQKVPKGQNMTQRSLEHIDAWGCEPQMRAARLTPRGVANGGLVTYGTILSDYAYDFMPRESVQPFYGQAVDRMPQYRTEAVLRARAAELDGIDTMYGWAFDGLTQDADGVTVGIKAHKGAATDTIRARYVVGCDGSKSGVRTAAEITQTLSDHDRKMVLLVFTSPVLHDILGEHYAARAFYNAMAPELDGYWRFLGRVDGRTEWFFHAPVPPDTTRENTDFAALLHAAVGRPFDLDVTYVGFWDLRFALADTYRAGRVLIAGDACHSHPPYGGYGINTGFEDARNLGWKLAATVQGWAGPDLLDSYDAERRPVFASTDRDFIRRFIEEDRAFLARHAPSDPDFAQVWAARNEGASEVFAFAPNYEGSPIIGGEGRPSAKGDHRFAARAGHHLAPRALLDGRSTYQALGPGFTLFDFGAGLAEDLAAAAQTRGVPLAVVTDTFDGERRDYEARAILVRPDGYVAWAGDTGEARTILSRATGT